MSYGWALSCCSPMPPTRRIFCRRLPENFAGPGSFDGRSTLKTWLFAVIRRTAAENGGGAISGCSDWAAMRANTKTISSRQNAAPAWRTPSAWEFSPSLGETAAPPTGGAPSGFLPGPDDRVRRAGDGRLVRLGRTHYERGKRRLGERLRTSEQFHEAEDQQLRELFAGLRQEDAKRAPAFHRVVRPASAKAAARSSRGGRSPRDWRWSSGLGARACAREPAHLREQPESWAALTNWRASTTTSCRLRPRPYPANSAPHRFLDRRFANTTTSEDQKL